MPARTGKIIVCFFSEEGKGLKAEYGLDMFPMRLRKLEDWAGVHGVEEADAVGECHGYRLDDENSLDRTLYMTQL